MDCLRKAFAPAIGGETNADCSMLLEHWEGGGNPPIPCANCLSQRMPTFQMSDSGKALWMDEANMAILKGIELEESEYDPLGHWEDVPQPAEILVAKQDIHGEPIWEWKIEDRLVPEKLFSNDGDILEGLELKKIGEETYKLEDPPLRSRAIVLFRDGDEVIGRFIDRTLLGDFQEEWF